METLLPGHPRSVQHMILSCDEHFHYDCLHGKNNAMVTDAQLCLWNLLRQFPNKIDFCLNKLSMKHGAIS